MACQASPFMDSPGNNAWVGYHSFLQVISWTQGLNSTSCIAGWVFTVWVTREAKSEVLVAQLCLTLCNPMDCNLPWDSPGKNIGVGCHSLLQGIFPTQVLKPGILPCRQIIFHLSHQGSLCNFIWNKEIFSTYLENLLEIIYYQANETLCGLKFLMVNPILFRTFQSIHMPSSVWNW